MQKDVKALSLCSATIYFGIPALYFWLLTKYLIPYLNRNLGMHAAISWFIVGLLIFVPLFLAAYVFARKEGNAFSTKRLLQRLRLNKFTKNDWKWASGGLLAVLVFTGLIMGVSELLAKKFGLSPLQTNPDFLDFEPFVKGEHWMLLVWLIMFFFNIVGEEIFWRGYIMPRQEISYPKSAWIINAILWGVFHISFGWQLLVILTPTLVILPYAVYKTKNTLVGIFIHGIFNGPMFLLVSLGLIK